MLESFYSMEDWQRPLLNRFKGFLLDSGAFTFLNTEKTVSNVDFENYADRYADFIKENRIKRYFELDIDSIVGLKETERLRKRIENRCGVQCIPVWHKNRGKEYFISMCKDYEYVALGGVVIKEIPLSLFEKMFPWFIDKAHEHGAQIHGLGYKPSILLNIILIPLIAVRGHAQDASAVLTGSIMAESHKGRLTKIEG